MPDTCPGPASPQTAHDPDVSTCPECVETEIVDEDRCVEEHNDEVAYAGYCTTCLSSKPDTAAGSSVNERKAS